MVKRTSKRVAGIAAGGDEIRSPHLVHLGEMWLNGNKGPLDDLCEEIRAVYGSALAQSESEDERAKRVKEIQEAFNSAFYRVLEIVNLEK